MATYASETHVRQIFNTYGITQGLDDDRDGSADSGLMAQILTDADAETESYVIVRYPSLALSGSATVPDIIKKVASKLAAGDALSRQGKRQFLRDQAVEWLKDLAAGDVILSGVTEAGLAESTTHEVVREFGYRQLDDMGEPSPRKMSTGDENDPFDP